MVAADVVALRGMATKLNVALYRDIVANRPKTADELARYIRIVFGYHIPRRAVCDGHSAPFAFFERLFLGNARELLLVAHRSGGKTLGLALAYALLAGWNNKVHIVSLAAITRQAMNCYAYHRELIWDNGVLRSKWVQEEPQARRTRYANGSVLEILPGTLEAVNGPHPQVLGIDELDLLQTYIYEQALSMPVSARGMERTVIAAGVRKWPNGLVQRCLDAARLQGGWSVVQYCVFETLRNCRKAGVSCEKCKGVIRADGASFWDICQGRGLESDGYQALEDVWAQFRMLSPAAFASEWLCERPELAALVFPDMAEYPDLVGDYEYDSALESYCGVDFGTVPAHQFVVLVGQVDEDGRLTVIDELVLPGAFPSEYMDLVMGLVRRYGVARVACDRSDAVQIRLLMEAGVPAMAAEAGRVKDGVAWVREAMVNGRLRINRRCKELIRQLANLRYPTDKSGEVITYDRYVKQDEHCVDALRYLCAGAGLLSGSGAGVSGIII